MIKRKKNKPGRETSQSDLANHIINDLQEKYNLSSSELKSLFQHALSSISEKEEFTFPISIVSKKLTVLESVVKFLREEKDKSLREISGILGRNEKNLWHTYRNASKKLSTKFKVSDAKILVPLTIFKDSPYSPLEALVVYLKVEHGLSYHEIAVLISRDDRTIWTVYNRARKKYEKT